MRTFRAIGFTSCIGGVAGLYSKMPYETKSGCFEYTATKVKPDYKIIHFIRHAEGVHNVAGEQDYPRGYLIEANVDAVLTEKGQSQCVLLAHNVISSGLVKNAELLVVSPMRRTLQTALYSFPHLIGKIPWVGLETLREESGLHPCDRRLPISDLAKQFPEVNFDNIEHDEDPLYYVYKTREPAEVVRARALSFMKWLGERPEREIIVVTHSNYVKNLLTYVISVEDDAPKKFKNCEIRSYVMSFPKDDIS